MTIIDQEGTMPKAPLGPSRQLLRLAGLTVAVVANIAWIGFLLYAAYDLAMLRRTLSVARHNNKSIWGPTTGPGAPTHGLNQLFAPILEIVAATTLLLCLAPILLISSVAIKLDSGGPVFTRVTRRDTSNRPIQVLRFRVVAASVPGENNQRLSSGRCCAD